MPVVVGSGGPQLARTAGRAASVLFLAAAAAVVSVWLPHGAWHGLFDLRVYVGADEWWRHGRPLYAYLYRGTPYGFTYPPFAALVLFPLTALPLPVVLVAEPLANLAVLVVLARRLVLPPARRHGWPLPFAWIAAVPVFFALEPVRETIGYGQVNLVLMALVLADLAALRRGSRWAGVGIGLAAAVKLTPALFVPYLLLTGRRRAAAVATGTALAASLLAAVVSPTTSWRFWTGALWQTDRVGNPDYTGNQSLHGGLARLADPGAPSPVLWAVLVVVVLVVVGTRAVRAARVGDELVGATLVGLAACLVSPIAWTHHLVWVVPALVVLLDVAAGRPPAPGAGAWWHRAPRALAASLAVATVLVFASSLVWFRQLATGYHHTHGALGLVVESGYLLAVLVLVLLLPARTAAGARVAGPGPASAGAVTPVLPSSRPYPGAHRCR